MRISLPLGHQDRIIFVFSYQVQILAPRIKSNHQIFGYDSVYTLTSNKVDIFFTTIDIFYSLYSCLKQYGKKKHVALVKSK